MQVRLSDAATAAILAEHYRTQALTCSQMALVTMTPYKEVWVQLAAEWTKLALSKKKRLRSAN